MCQIDCRCIMGISEFNMVQCLWNPTNIYFDCINIRYDCVSVIIQPSCIFVSKTIKWDCLNWKRQIFSFFHVYKGNFAVLLVLVLMSDMLNSFWWFPHDDSGINYVVVESRSRFNRAPSTFPKTLSMQDTRSNI